MKVSFQMIGKKGNIVSVHKKDLETMLTNYHPISLLPIFAKIFEIIIFTPMFDYLKKMNFSQFVSLVFFQAILPLCNS